MLNDVKRSEAEVEHFFSVRGLDVVFLVVSGTSIGKSTMDANSNLVDYMRRSELHDYALQAKGSDGIAIFRTWFVEKDDLIETESVLYRSDTASGDPKIFVKNLTKHASSGNFLALLVRENEIFIVNTSRDGLVRSAADPSSPFSYVLDLVAAAKMKPLEDRFSEWNLRLLRSFFSEASGGEEVFLRVDRDLLDQMGQDIGGDAGFLEAVRKGPSWTRATKSFTRNIIELKKDRTNPKPSYKDPGNFDAIYRGLSAPTYLPYLAALVRNDAENASAYYARLSEDLKLQYQFSSQEMGQVETVWADLEKWTAENHGRFGYFKMRRLGGYRLVGVPRSQSILKPSDVEDLARVFVQAEVRPGQDLPEETLTRILREARSTGSTFTAGFQKALNIDDFEQPIREAIRTAYSDWDGTLPANRGVGKSADSSPSFPSEADLSVGISLSVVQDSPLQLSPGWRISALQDTGEFQLSHGNLSWSGQFSGIEGATSAPCPDQETEVWDIAKRAADSAFQFQVFCFDGEDSEPTELQLTLVRHPLWVLVPVLDHVTENIELREGELPASGSAFLLAPPQSVHALQGYIEREQPHFEKIAASGIPESWLLIRLVECESLSQEQRILPDGERGSRPRPRAIRFVGGRSIRRGYSRMYLPYDLPSLELDAPVGAFIECSEGIEVDEVSTANLNGIDHVDWKPTRRFNLTLQSSKSAFYEFKAFAVDGSELGQAKLRIADLGGEIVDTGKPFSLDKIGRPMHSSEGLSGVILGASNEEPRQLPSVSSDFELTDDELGGRAFFETSQVGVHEKFLDALAQSGSMDFGVARDLLQRLLVSGGESDKPVFIILELRRRGFLGVSTTHKGHIARIHAIKPALYSLPLVCSGKHIWAVAGTLRIDHWKYIASESEAWNVYRPLSSDCVFGPWRLIIKDKSLAIEICSQIGFQFTEKPCFSVADWSATLGAFRDETFQNTMESIGNARNSAMRLNASTGRFTATPSGVVCELWKVRDLDIGVGNLYVLAEQGKYAFVSDSRWGVWLALDAFAKYMSSFPRMDGVHPLPITYESAKRTIWLPARINLPTVLERALILCSGDSPDVVTLQNSSLEDAGSRLHLTRTIDGSSEFSANLFYTDMANGRWLAYRYVPELIARTIATKLGAVLDVI
ncbi:hypothetical protein ACJO5Y_13330 [Marinobacter sp. GN3S48]|uniref:hypothetical protein n=1 Tax=Marinobacter sp. GN3S48 TaxID=3382302 RepID=UPI00387ADB24